VRAWSEVLDKARHPRPVSGRSACGWWPPRTGPRSGALKGEDGKYLPDVLLDLDYWALMPE
jgi:2-methylfumaryl-CoA hydratase